ncbi:MAG: hypothetical protein M1834_005246 [Cirrosporium novae-zelandiae]|nr:MAG: hypothetical protein M1834_005246 [Cirrosporium novae-zelandiae]
MARHYPHERGHKRTRSLEYAYITAQTTAKAVRDSIPGWKTSAAFLSSLRYNLHLTITDPDLLFSSTPSTTPDSLRASTSSLLPPPSPLSPLSTITSAPFPPLSLSPPSSVSSTTLASMDTSTTMVTPSRQKSGPTTLTSPLTPPASPIATDPLPTLLTTIANTPSAQESALHLIADSVAQQRQSASRAIIFHPLTLAAYFLALAFIYRVFGNSSRGLGVAVTTTAGITMTALIAIRWATSGYIARAEEVGTWGWLRTGYLSSPPCSTFSSYPFLSFFATGNQTQSPLDEGEDIIWTTTYGNTTISVLLVRFIGVGGRRGRKRGAGKAVVRAWTTKLRYRGKDVGRAILEEGVRWGVRERGVERWGIAGNMDGGSGSGSGRSIYNGDLLPRCFRSGFLKREKRAMGVLDEVVEEVSREIGRRRYSLKTASGGSF